MRLQLNLMEINFILPMRFDYDTSYFYLKTIKFYINVIELIIHIKYVFGYREKSSNTAMHRLMFPIDNNV